jgi:hypothetical protein
LPVLDPVVQVAYHNGKKKPKQTNHESARRKKQEKTNALTV